LLAKIGVVPVMTTVKILHQILMLKIELIFNGVTPVQFAADKNNENKSSDLKQILFPKNLDSFSGFNFYFNS
jgi:hypothetical protein